MKYIDLKLRVLDILCYNETEAERLGYMSKIPRILNEGLFRIANSLATNLREFTITLKKSQLPAKVEMPPDFIAFSNEQDAFVNSENFILTRFSGKNSIILTGTEVFDLPETLTYIIYYSAQYPRISGSSSGDAETFTEVLLNNDGTWNISNEKSISQYIIPDNIADLLPHYIVGQLLTLDDKVRSVTELNMFEVMLAQLDTDRNEHQREYHSSRGWY